MAALRPLDDAEGRLAGIGVDDVPETGVVPTDGGDSSVKPGRVLRRRGRTASRHPAGSSSRRSNVTPAS